MQFELQQKKRLQTRIHIVRILTEIGKDLLEIGKYVFFFVENIRRLDYLKKRDLLLPESA